MNTDYTKLAQLFHWIIALLIFVTLPLGFVMTDMDFSPEKLQYYSWHKWIGVSVFALTLLRAAWRWVHPAPSLPAHMSGTAKLLAHLGHLALYALTLVIPLSGWLMSSAKGVQTVWFGVLPIPDLIAKDKALGHDLAELHETLCWVLIALLVVHVLAALKHQFIDRDQLLSRMLPRVFPKN